MKRLFFLKTLLCFQAVKQCIVRTLSDLTGTGTQCVWRFSCLAYFILLSFGYDGKLNELVSIVCACSASRKMTSLLPFIPYEALCTLLWLWAFSSWLTVHMRNGSLSCIFTATCTSKTVTVNMCLTFVSHVRWQVYKGAHVNVRAAQSTHAGCRGQDVLYCGCWPLESFVLVFLSALHKYSAAAGTVAACSTPHLSIMWHWLETTKMVCLQDLSVRTQLYRVAPIFLRFGRSSCQHISLVSEGV